MFQVSGQSKFTAELKVTRVRRKSVSGLKDLIMGFLREAFWCLFAFFKHPHLQ